MLAETIFSVCASMAPPPELSISEHADKHRYLSQEYCAEPGKYHTSRTEYLREIMDSVCNETVQQVVVMSSARVGKTTFIENVCHYFICNDPAGGILIVQPTKESADYFSKVQLASMIRDNPVLRAKIFTSASDDTLSHKAYYGGSLDIVSSNSPSGLSAKTKRVICCDEVDRYEESTGDEGDPVSLAIKRATTFFNRKIILCSTPKIKGESRIEAAFLDSDKRYYHIPCPKCEEIFSPKWAHVKWEKSEDQKTHYPESAYLECPHCLYHINDAEKNAAVRHGTWIATDPTKTIRGYHLWEIFSPWRLMKETVEDFLKAKESTETLKTFINLSLGESFEEHYDKQNPEPFYERREDFKEKVPRKAGILVGAVDVQADRLVLQIVGFGKFEEAFVVAYKTIIGMPTQPETWERLDRELQKEYIHESGHKMHIASVFIDSGAFTEDVYEFCRDRESRLIYPSKGSSMRNQPLVSLSEKNRNEHGVRIIHLGTDTAKGILFSRLKLEAGGAGYIHFSDVLPRSYFEELVSESLITVIKNGRETHVWKKTSSSVRNEALDTWIYCLCCVNMLDPDYDYFDTMLNKKSLQEVKCTHATSAKENKEEMEINIIDYNSMQWGLGRW